MLYRYIENDYSAASRIGARKSVVATALFER